MKQAASKIIIACGGTGGHLFPGIAVAEEFQARGHQARLLISEKKIDAEASHKYSALNFQSIPAIGTPPLRSPRIIPFAYRLLKSIHQCGRLLDQSGAQVVLGMGGFTSLPPIFAGSRRKLQCFVHDSNALPGRANRLTARFCDQVFVGFEAARSFFPKSSVKVTGTPARKELSKLPERATAASKFGLDPQRPTALIMGGSQGAQQLNSWVAEAAKDCVANKSPWQFLHLSGLADAERLRGLVSGKDYHVIPFCDDMASAYAACDVAICRAGASSLTELALVGLPSLLVPYPYAADDHQTFNAQSFVEAGAAELIQESELNPAKIIAFLDQLENSPQRRNEMAEAASSIAVKDSAKRIVDLIESSLTP